MFTILARVLTSRMASAADQGNFDDRPMYDGRSEDRIFMLLLHVRQDLKLISFLMFEIIFMLGIVADVVLLSAVFADKLRLLLH